MKKSIEQAFRDFDSGKRPPRYKPPKHWYVLNSKGQSYPAKAIWAMANNVSLGNFNTRDARIGFAEFEYSLIDARQTAEYIDFEAEIEKSKNDSEENRKKRLQRAPRKPKIIYTVTKSFRRNPDVVAEVVIRANGSCEKCNKSAPFLKKKDNSPYLEVHHVHHLSNGGDDTVENSIALCPNCHRKSHFG